VQKFLVVARLGELVGEKFHGFDRGERVDDAAQDPGALQLFLGDEQLFLAGAGALDIDGGEDALVYQLAVEDDFHVAGALELLEDDLVHARAGVDQRGGDDGQAAAFLDVAGRAEEALRPLKSIGVDAAGEDLAGGRDDGVVGASETGDGVEQDDHVALVFDQALGLLDDHLGDLDVAGGGLVEGGADDFALDAALHIGDFLGALVDEQDDEDDLGVVGGDGVGDGLQQHGLAGAGRGDDEAALALADRSEQVHDPTGDLLADGLHLDALLGVERGEVIEENLVLGLLGRLEVDGLDLDQGKVLLALVGRPDVAADGVAGFEVELADLGGRDVDVVGAGEIVVIGRAEEAVAVGEDFEHSLGEDVALLFALGLEDLEDEVLLAKAGGSGDVEAASKLAQFCNVVLFEFGDCHFYLDIKGGFVAEGEIAWREALAGICVSRRKAGNSEALLDVMDYTLAGGLKCSENFGVTGRWSRRPGLPPRPRRPRGLGRAAFLERDAADGRLAGYAHGNGILEAVEHLVGGILQTGVGLVQLAGRL
jgi:hypothetical protein